MGCSVSSNKPKKIILLGLSGSGKTALLYQISQKRRVPAIPTIGFNEQSFVLNKQKIQLFEFGGKQTDFALVKHNFDSCNGIIYVIDMVDQANYQESIEYLKQILQQRELQIVPLLILLNKSDIKQKNVIQSAQLKKDIKGFIQENQVTNIIECSAFENIQVSESFQWIIENMNR